MGEGGSDPLKLGGRGTKVKGTHTLGALRNSGQKTAHPSTPFTPLPSFVQVNLHSIPLLFHNLSPPAPLQYHPVGYLDSSGCARPGGVQP